MKILFLSFAPKNSSIDGVYIKGLRKNNVEVIDYSFHGIHGYSRYAKILQKYRLHAKDIDYVIVGYDSPSIIIFLWPLCRKKLIYNALCSVYERLIISRQLAGKISLKGYYYWLLDFLACRIACFTMLESRHQIEYFKKIYKLPEKKFYHAWIGADEEKFFYQPNIEKNKVFTVLFRGRLLPEAGGSVVVGAAKFVEQYPIHFLMLANGMELERVQKLIQEFSIKNITLITEYLSDEKLLLEMQKCHLSLGQLSSHERLERTIPHKAYESLALKLPYLTARNPGVMELLREGETCLAFKPNDAEDLANTILWAFHHKQTLQEIAENGYELFCNALTTEKLGASLLEKIKNSI